MDIPGYYYDPHTRRYFKQDPAHPRPSILDEDGVCSPTMASKNPKKTHENNMIDLLNARELGNCRGSFRSSIFSLQAQSLRCLQSFESYPLVVGATSDYEVSYVKGTGNQQYVERKLPKGYLLSEDTCILQSKCHFKAHSTTLGDKFVVDLCESPEREYLCLVQSSAGSWKVSVGSRSVSLDMLSSKPYKSPIWCCDVNYCSEIFLTGERGKVGVWDVHRLTQSHHVMVSQGHVTALQCSKVGSLCLVGVNTGHLEWLDLRDSTVRGYKLHSKGINELILLQDEYSIICGSFDGWMCNLDLRMQRKLFEYCGHKHTVRKTPFSMSEKYDVLSATGSDGITRIWSLSQGGHPVKTIVPPEKGSPCHSCISEQNMHWNLFLYQGKSFSIYGIKDW